MGILLVYDVTDESSFNNIRNWFRNIEQHASDNVNKILVGNEADMDESKRTFSILSNPAKPKCVVGSVHFLLSVHLNEVWGIKHRLEDTNSKAEPSTIKINKPDQAAGAGQAAQGSACCGST
ncbi:Ras-related protein RAB1BV [Hibiscus syriacus]|uniref:Ras-related protein RAB1BV n=1 Tax=Hibiscus syriacus TaxID=106335 RepID=A0A6A3A8Y7_HIBSY|nr:Ras-related protein RAB1BV [Hibiscus syriacus]